MTGLPAALAGHPIVPVVVIDDPARAADLAHALVVGGISTAEFTLRTPAALDAIRAAAEVPGFVAGVGTVLDRDALVRARDAGARYAVSPGLDDEVLDAADELGVPLVPGVATATEVQRALRRGLDHLKLFPAGPLGGPAHLDTLAGPFPGVRFLPSGGVRAADLAAYLSCASVFAVSGSWMVSRDAIARGAFDEISDASRAASTAAADALAARAAAAGVRP